MEYITRCINRACAVVTLSMLYVIAYQHGPELTTVALATATIGRNVYNHLMVHVPLLIMEQVCIVYISEHVMPLPIIPILQCTFHCAAVNTIVSMVSRKVMKRNRRPTRLVVLRDDNRSIAAIDRIAPVLNYTEPLQCTICITDLLPTEPHRRLPCGHAFHAPCIEPWLMHRAMTCPVCRYRI